MAKIKCKACKNGRILVLQKKLPNGVPIYKEENCNLCNGTRYLVVTDTKENK